MRLEGVLAVSKCKYSVTGGTCSDQELEAYRQRALDIFEHEPSEIIIRIDGDYVELDYKFLGPPFERIRRITGYLTGTVERSWNNAKQKELSDRVKHG